MRSIRHCLDPGRLPAAVGGAVAVMLATVLAASCATGPRDTGDQGRVRGTYGGTGRVPVTTPGGGGGGEGVGRLKPATGNPGNLFVISEDNKKLAAGIVDGRLMVLSSDRTLQRAAAPGVYELEEEIPVPGSTRDAMAQGSKIFVAAQGTIERIITARPQPRTEIQKPDLTPPLRPRAPEPKP